MFATKTLAHGRLSGSRQYTTQLLGALAAAERNAMYQQAHAVIKRTGDFLAQRQNIVSALIGEQDFIEWRHYPEVDAHTSTGSLFYYHAHAAAQQAPGEHGHFHFFAANITATTKATPRAFTHLIGMSMNKHGWPMRVFTTNQWVTAEIWEPAHKVIGRLHETRFDRSRPVRIGRLLQAMLDLFRPQIEQTILLRDARIEAMRADGRSKLLQDRRTHIISQCPVDLTTQVFALEQAGVDMP